MSQKTDSTLALAHTENNLSTMLGIIQGALQNGNTVAFVGFGNFSVKERVATKREQPKDGRALRDCRQ